MTATIDPTRQTTVEAPPESLRVSSYDRTSGMLVTMLIVVGVLVFLLFLIWLSNTVPRIRFAPPEVTAIIDEPMGRGDNPEGVGRDMEEPGVEELADMAEPGLAGTLDGIAVAVSSQADLLEALEGNVAESGDGPALGNSTRMGTGKGLGDNRGPGPGGDGNANIVPRWERWEVRYTTTDVKAYAAQLDFFKVELAAVGGGRPVVDYASNLSRPAPTTRTGASKDEKRLRLTWTGGALKDFDQQLLRSAGIDTNRRLVMQFYPPEAEAALAAIENKEMNAKKKKLTEIKKTVFGVRPGGARFEFYLIGQEYRLAL